MARPANEVTEELRAFGWRIADKDDALFAAELAKRLELAERLVDALPGRRWFPDTFNAFRSWFVMTPRRLFGVAIDSGGWFSGPRVRQLSETALSDILEARQEFTSGQGAWQGQKPTTLRSRRLLPRTI
jgi:hypothetical protein